MTINKKIMAIFMLYFSFAIITGYIDFDMRPRSLMSELDPKFPDRIFAFSDTVTYIQKVIDYKEGQPYINRMLIPNIYGLLTKVIPLQYIVLISRLFLIFLSYCLFHIYLKHWFDDKTAIIGVLSMAALIPLTLNGRSIVITDFPELICYILGCMWIRDKKDKLLYFLIPLATYNRETAFGLVIIYALYRKNLKSLLMFSLFLIPFLLSRLIFGFPEWHFIHGLEYNLSLITKFFQNFNIYNNALFFFHLFGFYWVLMLLNFKSKDIFLKKAAIIIPIFAIMIFALAGRIDEPRVFIPFFPIIIPLGLFTLNNLLKENLDKI